jgi:hypothetical protein
MKLQPKNGAFVMNTLKQWEFAELKEKKAIFMNDTGSKIYYRVQNMGIIFWDYYTNESRRIQIEIMDKSFYSAVCAFSI